MFIKRRLIVLPMWALWSHCEMNIIIKKPTWHPKLGFAEVNFTGVNHLSIETVETLINILHNGIKGLHEVCVIYLLYKHEWPNEKHYLTVTLYLK